MPKTVGVAVSNATFHFDKLYTYAVLPEDVYKRQQQAYAVYQNGEAVTVKDVEKNIKVLEMAAQRCV